MTDRRRNLFVLLLVAGLLVASLAVIVTQADAPGPGPQGRRLAHLPGQADQAVGGHRRRHRPLAGHHAQARRPDRRRRAEPPALGRRPDRRLAARRQERRRGGLAGRHHRPDVVLRLGGQRPRAQLQARSAERERDRRAGGRRRAASRPRCRSSTPSRAARSARAPTPARSPRATSSIWSTRSARRSWPAPTRAVADLQKEALNKKIPFDAKQVVKVPQGTVIVRAEQPDPKGTPPPAWYVLADQPILGGTDIKNPEQNFDNGPGESGQPNVTFDFTGHGAGVWSKFTRKLSQRGQEFSLGAPGRRVQPALRHHARQRADLGPADRLAPVPRRPGRRPGVAHLGRLHHRLRPAAGQPAQDRRPADQARAHLRLAGLGHAGQAGAQPGPHRGRGRLHHRRALPARSSTACWASSRSAPSSSTRSSSTR